MAKSRFSSQQSETMINVSAYHESADSTPESRHHEEAKVLQSPVIEDSQSDACVPGSAERVEDSYQKSPVQRTGDEEDELYTVSPKGRASLDATIAARKVLESQQPANMPKRNLIDALLDNGAAVPSSASHAAATRKKPLNDTGFSTSTQDYVVPDTEFNAVDTNVELAVEKHCGDGTRKIHDSRSKAHRARSPAISRGNHTKNLGIANRSASPASVHGDSGKASRDSLESTDFTEPIVAEQRRTAISNDKSTDSDARDTSRLKNGSVRPKSQAIPAKTAHDRESLRLAAPNRESNGRPQRQAKQSALAKLKAEQSNNHDDFVDGLSERPEGEETKLRKPTKSAKKGSNRDPKPKQLPTPVTNGDAPRSTMTSIAHGKLKLVKSQAAVVVDVKKPRVTQASRVTQSSVERTGRSAVIKDNDESLRPPTDTESMRPSADPQVIDQDVATKVESQGIEGVLSMKRPGTLKRPARSFSRGRRPRRESPYGLPGNTPAVKRKARSISRASKASTVRAGPTRQRMQVESVKDRVDCANQDVRPALVSRHSTPGVSKATGPARNPSVASRKDEGSRALSRSVSRPSEQQRGRSIGPLVQSNQFGAQNNKTTTKPASSHRKFGSSQANAITIEQDSEPSTSSSPSPYKPTIARSEVALSAHPSGKDTERPQTPAMMPSSPPGSGRDSVYTLAKEKPTIIAFGRHGPKNQGSTSARKYPGSAGSSKMFSDYKSVRAGTPIENARTSGLATQLFPPASRPGNPESKQSANMLNPSNVSKRLGSVFGEFTKDGKNKALASVLQQSALTKDHADQDRDDGFAVIDQFEGTTLIDDNDEEAGVTKQLTASQHAMPPPKLVDKDRKYRTTVALDKGVPTKASVKPVATRDTPRPALPSNAANVSTAENDRDTLANIQTKVTVVGKDTRRYMPLSNGAKRLPAKEAPESKPPHDGTLAQASQQPRKRGISESQAGSPSKKSKSTRGGSPAALGTKPTRTSAAFGYRDPASAEPRKHIDRRKNRVSRRVTQGSQGVDILGSPYPKDLEVPTQTTALEVYSQQADLSSDHVASSDAVLNSRLDLKAVPVMIPTTKAGLVSSNGKPRPAAPYESSKAVTRVASGPLAEQFLAARPMHTSEENPFTSSRERESTGGNATTTARFREALRERGIDLNDQPTAARLGTRNIRQDRTLVEPMGGSKAPSQYISSSPGSSEASSVSTADTAARVLEDVGDWRNSLNPHQVHLFDSLVIAAHKLVRHMVDHETADRNMVEDYRRRGEIIVTELQRAHVLEYEQYKQNVHDWRLQAANELAAHGKRLKQSMRDAEKAKAERRKAHLARNDFDDMLKELVARLD